MPRPAYTYTSAPVVPLLLVLVLAPPEPLPELLLPELPLLLLELLLLGAELTDAPDPEPDPELGVTPPPEPELGAGPLPLPLAGAEGGEPLPLLPVASAVLATSNMETTVSPSTSNINVFLLISTSLPRCKNCL